MASSRGKWVKPELLKGGELWLADGAVLDEDWPLRFEVWCGENLVWPAGYGGGEPVLWQQWQREKIIWPLLGPVWSEPPEGAREGDRVVRQCFYLSARGTGKTSLGAALALWCLDDGWDPAPDIDLFAVSREQADRLFKEASSFIVNSVSLVDRYHIMADRKKIHPEGVRTYGLHTRSGDSKAELGLRPTLTIIDELLSQKNRELWDTIKTAQGKRPGSLLISFTTPDVAVETFARKEYERAKSVMKDRSASPEYLPVIFESERDDDPHSPQTWVKAAPALESGFLDWSIYRNEAEEARLDPTALQAFKVFRLAQWADSGHGYLNMDLWDRSVAELPHREDLQKLPCFFGLDMSKNDDITSLCLLFTDSERDCLWTFWRHWMTDISILQVNNFTHGNFSEWMRQEQVSVTQHQGNYISGYDVSEEVAELAYEFQPESIGIDAFRAGEINKLLGEGGHGFAVQQLRTTGRGIQAATERVSAEVSARRLLHNGDGVARWAASNCEVKYDLQGFPKVMKLGGEPKSPMKIDPIDALIMACDRMLEWERTEEEVADAYLPSRYKELIKTRQQAKKPDKSELVVG